MKNCLVKSGLFLVFILIMTACGSNSSQSEATEEKAVATVAVPQKSLGVGPVTSVTLAADIDEAMASKGKEVYEAKCTACHRVDQKFIGPSPKGIFERRSPEWIMNMILAPEKMVAEDADAKALLIEFNGAPMANQNLSEEEARSVLEYFRTL